MTDPRQSNPQLHVAAAHAALTREGVEIRSPQEPSVEYYGDWEGVYVARHPHGRLYRDVDQSDGYFANTDDRLPDLAPRVVGVVVRWHQGTRAFGSLAEFVAWAFPAGGAA